MLFEDRLASRGIPHRVQCKENSARSANMIPQEIVKEVSPVCLAPQVCRAHVIELRGKRRNEIESPETGKRLVAFDLQGYRCNAHQAADLSVHGNLDVPADDLVPEQPANEAEVSAACPQIEDALGRTPVEANKNRKPQLLKDPERAIEVLLGIRQTSGASMATYQFLVRLDVEVRYRLIEECANRLFFANAGANPLDLLNHGDEGIDVEAGSPRRLHLGRRVSPTFEVQEVVREEVGRTRRTPQRDRRVESKRFYSIDESALFLQGFTMAKEHPGIQDDASRQLQGVDHLPFDFRSDLRA